MQNNYILYDKSMYDNSKEMWYQLDASLTRTRTHTFFLNATYVLKCVIVYLMVV